VSSGRFFRRGIGLAITENANIVTGDDPSMRLLKILLLSVALVVFGGRASAAETATEYELKAAFLFNFARFVEWPTAPESAFDICVIGEDPFGSVLDRTVEKKVVHDQPLVARRVEDSKHLDGCRILFVAVADEEQERTILRAAAAHDILTVGEKPDFAERGGMIELGIEEKRIRIEINLAAVERSKLKVSSQLLKLAKIVDGGSVVP
jgi:hypothetical protein